jgi:hypothetical protein
MLKNVQNDLEWPPFGDIGPPVGDLGDSGGLCNDAGGALARLVLWVVLTSAPSFAVADDVAGAASAAASVSIFKPAAAGACAANSLMDVAVHQGTQRIAGTPCRECAHVVELSFHHHRPATRS